LSKSRVVLFVTSLDIESDRDDENLIYTVSSSITAVNTFSIQVFICITKVTVYRDFDVEGIRFTIMAYDLDSI
jgi:hypothetical protein